MQQKSDDFLYSQPMQSMYLSTIPNKTKRINPNSQNIKNILKVQDIQGTRPKFIQKPLKPHGQSTNFINKNDDIQKSKSRILIQKQIKKANYSMEVDDIKGTRSQLNKFVSTRHTDPLNPVYQIPKVQYYPVQQPKFIRNNLQIYDIQGTRTKQTFAMKLQRQGKVLNSKQQVLKSIQLKKYNHFNKQGKRYMNVSQDQGFIDKKQVNLILDVSDINLKKQRIVRNTNPLDPEYKINNKWKQGINVKNQSLKKEYQNFGNGTMNLQKINVNSHSESKDHNQKGNDKQTSSKLLNKDKQDKQGFFYFGQIQKSKPPEPKKKFNNPDFSLQTNDIPGAKTKVNNFVMSPKQQIKQAKSGTLKKGICSNRKINPLTPNYNYPGCSQVNKMNQSQDNLGFNNNNKNGNFNNKPINTVNNGFKQAQQNNSSSVAYQRPKTALQRFDAFIK